MWHTVYIQDEAMQAKVKDYVVHQGKDSRMIVSGSVKVRIRGSLLVSVSIRGSWQV